MTDYIITTQGLTKRFGNKTALNNFNLNIPRGGIHAIIGANGAGKSTLFRILLGLEAPSEGETKILGTDSEQLTPALRGRIGYVNEEHTLPMWMTVSDLVSMQKELYNDWQQTIFDNVIANFDVQPKQKVSALSRGERAGLNLSMALAQAPEILILDEPTLGLDVIAKQAFLEALMHTETDLETTIIYCSHQMEEIERIAENLIIIESGEVKYFTNPDDFCDQISYWIGCYEGNRHQLSQMSEVLSVKIIDDQYHITVANGDLQAVKTMLTNVGCSDLINAPISLDKAINAVLAKNHHSAEKTA